MAGGAVLTFTLVVLVLALWVSAMTLHEQTAVVRQQLALQQAYARAQAFDDAVHTAFAWIKQQRVAPTAAVLTDYSAQLTRDFALEHPLHLRLQAHDAYADRLQVTLYQNMTGFAVLQQRELYLSGAWHELP